MIPYYLKRLLNTHLITKLSYTDIQQLPKVEKIIMHLSVNKSMISEVLPLATALMLFTSQKPALIVSKAVSIRMRFSHGVPVGCKIVLRGPHMELFLEKLICFILPKLQTPLKISQNPLSISVDGFLFKEIQKEYEYFQKLPPIKIQIFLANSSIKDELLVFFNLLKFPLKHISV